MAVEIKFDANQQFQRDAIDRVVELFAGQDGAAQGFTTAALDAGGTLDEFRDLVFGNSLNLTGTTIETNLRRVQDTPILQPDGSESAAVPEHLRQPFDGDALDFSVEMETGTGKTYVYLRSIAELHRRYGFAKFVVVVPSVAIREGVLSSLRLLKSHIRDLYDGLQFDSYVWDSRFPNRVRQFATTSHLQIMVINIDSFTKETNIMKKVDPDRLNGFAPIEYLRACHPIVIMDEPQNMETPVRRSAVADLFPLFRLRYSATHRDPKHLVYRLTPVDAYDLRLVKRIGVLSVTKDDDLNEAYVEVLKINATPTGVTATARIHKSTHQGTRLTQVTLHKDDDLCELSGGRSVYQGWAVEDIHVGQNGASGFVEFNNLTKVREGAPAGGDSEQQQRLMIHQAVLSHFNKELQLTLQARRGTVPAAIKPLTLFFIDKVANYHPADSKFRRWFEDSYELIRSDGRFRALKLPDVADVHDGYFAETAKGEPKDLAVGKDTKDAESAFERIMRKKEELLSFDVPLRFIFSHSALVEGWDNPNVFTICNLQDGKSEMRKRQQIGRGLRLPVMENGERCRVDEVNMVTVIAHEGFAKFAGDLQKEIEDETGISFEGRVTDLNRDKIKLRLKEEVLEDPLFQELWDHISRQTTYHLSFETDDVIAEAVKRINAMEPLEPIKFRIALTEADLSAKGILAGDATDRGTVEVEGARRLPDVVGELTRRVPLSRATIVRILKLIDNVDQVLVNPSVFIDQVESAMNQALYSQVAKGIVYSPDPEKRWRAEMLKKSHQDETIAKADFVVPVTKSVVDKIVCDSKVEVQFARDLEKHPEVSLFLKLPEWFKVPTPLGNYNPDWAIVREEPDGRYLYLVRETKGTDQIEKLQWESEGWKIKFGEAHFRAIGVDYAFGEKLDVLIEPSAYR